MYSLIAGLVAYLTRRDEFRVLVVGLDQAGKTSALERLKTLLNPSLPGMEQGRIVPTVGLNVGRVDAFGARLVFWDLGGQPGLRGIWDKYYAETHALVFVVDAASPDRFDEARAALEKALDARDLAGAPLLLIANKQDAPGAAGLGEVAEAFGLGGVQGRACIAQPACALTGQGLSDGVKWLVEATKRSPRRHVVRGDTAGGANGRR